MSNHSRYYNRFQPRKQRVKPPSQYVPRSALEATAMLVYGDLPRHKPRGGLLGLHAPMSLGMFLVVLSVPAYILFCIFLHWIFHY